MHTCTYRFSFFFFFFSPPLISLLYYAYCVTQYQSLSGEEGRKEGKRKVLLSSGKSKCTSVSSRFDKEREKREGRIREERERK